MSRAGEQRQGVQLPLLITGATAWLLLVAEPDGHGSPGRAAGPPVSPVGWVLMLAAMMSPLLVAPLCHVRDRSFTRRRVRAVALFLTGYGTVWTAAGAGLLALAWVARSSGLDASLVAVAAVAGAVGWQSSPVKQRCLNRAHAHPELAAFGTAAEVDALGFGITHGAWCTGSCWALMALPLVVPAGHLAVMATVTLWLAAERLDRPMPVGWRLRVPRKAVRLALAQARRVVRRPARA